MSRARWEMGAGPPLTPRPSLPKGLEHRDQYEQATTLINHPVSESVSFHKRRMGVAWRRPPSPAQHSHSPAGVGSDATSCPILRCSQTRAGTGRL